jgi:hypothetical protein
VAHLGRSNPHHHVLAQTLRDRSAASSFVAPRHPLKAVQSGQMMVAAVMTRLRQLWWDDCRYWERPCLSRRSAARTLTPSVTQIDIQLLATGDTRHIAVVGRELDFPDRPRMASERHHRCGPPPGTSQIFTSPSADPVAENRPSAATSMAQMSAP